MDPTQAKAVFKAMGNESASTFSQNKRHPFMHRTETIDYAVVLSGEVDMQLDDGTEVHLRAGDVLVQRGTIHNWINRGTAPCVMAFTLIEAKPVEVGGKMLHATG